MFLLFSFSSLLFLLFKKEKKKGKTKEKDRLFLSFFFLLLFKKGKEKGKEKSSSPKREMRGKKIRNTRLFSFFSSSLFPLLREGKEREASSEKRKWRGKKERKKTLFEKNKVFNFTIFFLFYPSEARIKIFASRRGKRFCRNNVYYSHSMSYTPKPTKKFSFSTIIGTLCIRIISIICIITGFCCQNLLSLIR